MAERMTPEGDEQAREAAQTLFRRYGTYSEPARLVKVTGETFRNIAVGKVRTNPAVLGRMIDLLEKGGGK